MIIHHTGLRRSGTHAVAEWIIRHLDGLTGLANSVQSVPLRTFKSTHVFRDGVSVTDDLRAEVKRADSSGFDSYPKDHVMLTYEDFYTKMSIEDWLEATLEPSDVIQEHGDIVRAITIRSFWNMAASRIRMGERAAGRSGSWRDDAVEGWKALARYVLDNPGSPHVVSYDRLVGERQRAYRDDLRQRLGLPWDNAQRADDGLSIVAFKDYGGVGSSFDMYEYKEDAENMRTEDRWHGYLEHPIFVELRRDPELHDLSLAIFGWTIGVDGQRVELPV